MFIIYFLLFFFIQQVLNYTYKIHIYADFNFTIYIDGRNINKNYSYPINKEILEFPNKLNGSNISFSLYHDYNEYKYFYGYIELENNCSLFFTNNSLININKTPSSTRTG